MVMVIHLPIGLKSYRKMKEENYYTVDKSMMIQEFLNRGNEVTLVTRPRRFGKTINMSMMAEFFDITKKSDEIFQGTAIMKTEYASYINQYPTIFLTFADAKGNVKQITKFIKMQIRSMYQQYSHVFEKISEFEQEDYELALNGIKNDTGLENTDISLIFLMKKCHEYYGKKVMLFIDEYDTPFIEAHLKGSYDEIRSPLASILHTSLKTSGDLQYAMLTGIQRVAKDTDRRAERNLFSDLNNLQVCTVKDSAYGEYFGFTKEEVVPLLKACNLSYSEDVRKMYDGYNMGGIDIYNPWSILKYADAKILDTYWINTSSNTMLKKAMEDCDRSFQEGYEELMCTGFVTTDVNFETSFYEIKKTDSLWGLFVNAGYLTVDSFDLKRREYTLRIPNDEVRFEFGSLTANYLHVEEHAIKHMTAALDSHKWNEFLEEYREILMNTISYHDLIDENSYHTLLLGLLMWLKGRYEITSNRESGLGRYDILLNDSRNQKPSLLLEIKHTKEEKKDLKKLAKEGVQQAKEKNYAAGLKSCIIIGLAHRGKAVEMEIEE